MEFLTELLAKRPLWLDNANTVLLSLAVLCLVYYVFAGSVIGFGVANLWIWLGAAGLFALRPLVYLVLQLCGKAPAEFLPSFVKTPLWVLFFAFIAYFALFEAVMLCHSFSKGEAGLDYVIVLGAKVNGTEPSAALRYRIEKAAEYLSANPKTKLIASGGKGEDEGISEAECIKSELLKLGADESRIILEDRSTSTYENFAFSLKLMEDKSASVGVITNGFHLFRSCGIARTAGIKAPQGISASYKGVLTPHYLAREFVSFNADLIFGHIKLSAVFG